MKTQQFFNRIIFTLVLSAMGLWSFAQQNQSPVLAVLNIDSKGLELTPEQLGSIARTEITKLDLYQVMDIYDVNYIAEQESFSIENCYGKICMLEAAKVLGTQKMLTGSVEALEETTIVTMRLIDVKTETIEKTEVIEFVKVKTKIHMMLSLTLKSMYDLQVDEKVMSKLTQPFDYESSVNYPDVNQLNLNGPRMGFTMLTGDIGTVYSAPRSEGGFDSYPFMFQFGYQFEVKYLNEGDFQALFEFIPMVTGLDQGKFIPSVSILNGLRSNRYGWEFAFGPVISTAKETQGFFGTDGGWNKLDEYLADNPGEQPDNITTRLDSRGDYTLRSGFLIGVGKTLKSGRLNIPINAFMIPGKRGHQFGISMGFNATKYK